MRGWRFSPLRNEARWRQLAEESRGLAGLEGGIPPVCVRPCRYGDGVTAKIDPTLWGIHAGQTGDAHSLFLNQNVVALGWNEMPDLTSLTSDREAYKARLREMYPTVKSRGDSRVGGPAFSLCPPR